jgi:DNA recombination protein RmuC
MDFALILLGFAVLAAAVIVAVALLRRPAPTPESAPDPRLDTLLAAQGEISGRFQQTLEAQAQLQKALGERLDALTQRMGQSLAESAEKTAATLSGIGERLNVIDEAQKNVAALSGHVVSLQEILSDKQTRGAFAQERMEDIVSDQLPPAHYEFQATLSNGTRPDCVIRLSKDAGLIVIDSKFPLEAFELLRKAAGDDEHKLAISRIKSDVQKHVKDITSKYIIKGETQTPVIMFVPSEAIFSELHHTFPEILQRARQDSVAIVSPHLLWLAVTTMQSVLRDVKMREHAHTIQKEVGALLDDVHRLGDRVGKLKTHFDQTRGDIDQIETSMRGIDRHGERIAAVDFKSDETALPKLPAK